MATETRTMQAKFDGDAAGLARAVDRATRELRKYDGAADGAGKRSGILGRAMTSVGTGGIRVQGGLSAAGRGAGLLGGALLTAGGIVVTVGAGLLKMGDDAINSGLAIGKARTVFGESFPKIQAWATGSANAFGLTKNEAIGLGASIQDFLVPMGIARGSAADMSVRFLNLSGVLAQNSAGTRTAAEVADIFTSALAGEYDSLQSLGIGISAERVAQEQATIKKREGKKVTDEQARALAILTIAEQDSTDAKKLATTAEGRQARAVAETKAKLREKYQEIQQRLLPVVLKLWDAIDKKVVPAVEKFTKWLASPEGQASIQRWGEKVAQIAGDVADLADKLSKALGWIKKVNDAAAKLTGIGGAISTGKSILGKIPGFAMGGTIPPNTTAMVGERGRELITTGSRPVHVTPNHELGGAPMIAEIHVHVGDEVTRVVRTEIKADKRRTRRAVGAGALRGAPA